LSREHIDSCAICKTSEITADFGKIRSEGLGILDEAKRGRPGILTPAIDKGRHGLLTGGEKPFEVAG
jgi:hypothetical protein